MHIRPYVPADRAACLRLFDGNVPDFFTDAERADFAAFLDGLPGPYLVVEDGAGEAVACGGYAVDPATGRADLCWGMVRRDRHRRGIGRLLLEERLRRIAADPRATGVRLDTSQHTRAYYEHAGFRTLEVIPDGYAPGLHRWEMLRDARPADASPAGEAA